MLAAGGGGEETQPLPGPQLRWSPEPDVLRQLRLVHRAPPLAQNGLQGGRLSTACLCVCLLHPLLITHDAAITQLPSSLSDRGPEGELSRPVVLQPGGTAGSAVLQPGPHPPQPQKQLHVAAQGRSSPHQVSFYHSGFFWVCSIPPVILVKLRHGVKRKQIRWGGERGDVKQTASPGHILLEDSCLHSNTVSGSLCLVSRLARPRPTFSNITEITR